MSGHRSTVAIIGAGIAGLCLAQKLKKSALDVAVYERNQGCDYYGEGFWIEINSDGIAALKDCLAPAHFEKLLSVSRPTDRPDCRWLTRVGLQKYLLDGIGGAVQFGKIFSGYENHFEGGVEVQFADNTRHICDILVGADGVNSIVRQQLLPHARRLDTGIFAVGGVAKLTAEIETLLPRAAFEYPIAIFGPAKEQMFFAVWRASSPALALPGTQDTAANAESLHASDHLMWRFSTLGTRYGLGPMPEHATPQQLKTSILEIMAPWDAKLRRLVELIDISTIFPLPIRTCVPLKHWNTGNVTLVGDSIHGMAPYGGFGANMAMKDASLLGHALAEAHRQQKTRLQAISEYELQMIDYGFDAAQRSLALLENINGIEPISFYSSTARDARS